MDSLLFASAFVPSTTRSAPDAFLKHQIVHRQPLFSKGINLFVSLDFTPHEHKLIRDNNIGSVVIVERNLDYESTSIARHNNRADALANLRFPARGCGNFAKKRVTQVLLESDNATENKPQLCVPIWRWAFCI